MQAALAAVKRRMDGQFKGRDLEHTSTGAVVWENKMQWERLKMVKEGLLKSDSPRGIWELTPRGQTEARQLSHQTIDRTGERGSPESLSA